MAAMGGAVTIATLMATLGVDLRDFDRGLKQAESKAKGSAGQMGGAFDGLKGKVGGVNSALGTLASTAGGFVVGELALGGLSKFGEMAGDAIVGLNARLEQAQIAFSTMLGSGEAASTFLKDLQGFAARTPFEFPELVDASKRMLAFGFASKDVIPLLTAVGNSAAALGGGAEMINGVTTALGQMSMKGKVSAEEMSQLAERGIPAWQMLADKMGISIAEAMDKVSKGQVAAGTMIEAFQEGAAKRFPDMMAKQAETFDGAMSTISDSLKMAMATGFKPLFGLLSEGALQFAQFVQTEDFQRWATGLATSIQDTVTAVTPLIREHGPALVAVMLQIGATIRDDTLLAFNLFKTAVDDIHMIPRLSNALGQLQSAFDNVNKIIGGIGGDGGATSRIDGFQVAATVLGGVLNTLVLGPFEAFAFALNGLTTAVLFVKDAHVAAFTAVSSTVSSAMQLAGGAVAGFKGAVDALLPTIQTLGSDVVNGLWQGILSATAAFRSNLAAWIKTNVPEAVRKLLGISSPSKVTEVIGEQTAEGFIVGLESMAGDVAATVSKVFGGAVSFGNWGTDWGPHSPRFNPATNNFHLPADRQAQVESMLLQMRASALSVDAKIAEAIRRASELSFGMLFEDEVAGIKALMRGVHNPGLPFEELFGRRAAGGPVTANRPYLIGERGPELFVPGQSGHVVPDVGMMGGGLDYDRLAGRLADVLRRNPPVIQLDGRVISENTRRHLVRQAERNGRSPLDR